MYLSLAFLMGRNLCKAAAAPRLADNEEGCGLTMAALAVGRTGDGCTNAWHESPQEWPWLHTEIDMVCPAEHCSLPVKLDSYLELVTHLFDYHVFEPAKGDSAWTDEKFADYLHRIEPRETEADELKSLCGECGENCRLLYKCDECFRAMGECCFNDHRKLAHSSDSDTSAELHAGIRVGR